MSYRNQNLETLDVRDQRLYQQRLDQELDQYEAQWGIGSYLERRDSLLRDCPQMVQEKRFFHLGVDIAVPLNTDLYVPLDGTVTASDYEPGEGNYGNYTLIRHTTGDLTFYSFYGHLAADSLLPAGMSVHTGDRIGSVGDFHENGNWFHHVHLQILTERGLEEGYLSKGYCAQEELPHIADLSPSPLFLVRY